MRLYAACGGGAAVFAGATGGAAVRATRASSRPLASSSSRRLHDACRYLGLTTSVWNAQRLPPVGHSTAPPRTLVCFP